MEIFIVFWLIQIIISLKLKRNFFEFSFSFHIDWIQTSSIIFLFHFLIIGMLNFCFFFFFFLEKKVSPVGGFHFSIQIYLQSTNKKKLEKKRREEYWFYSFQFSINLINHFGFLKIDLRLNDDDDLRFSILF